MTLPLLCVLVQGQVLGAACIVLDGWLALLVHFRLDHHPNLRLEAVRGRGIAPCMDMLRMHLAIHARVPKVRCRRVVGFSVKKALQHLPCTGMLERFEVLPHWRSVVPCICRYLMVMGNYKDATEVRSTRNTNECDQAHH